MEKRNLLTRMLLLFALIVGSTQLWATDYYEKVTSTSDVTDGQYLIVYETGNVAFNGGLATLDAASNTISVTISDFKIESTTTTDAAAFTIDVTNGTILSASKLYIGGKSGSNTLVSNVSSSDLTNTFSIDTNGNFVATSNTSVLRYNKGSDQMRFRYYKSSGYSNQQAIQLYKFVSSTPVEKTDPTITFNNGSVRVGKTLDLSTLFTSNSTGAVTYSITAGDSFASLDGTTLTGVAEGSVTVKAEQATAGNYNAGDASATITVNAALTLSSIAITTAPTKTTYNEGEFFDATGMVVTATYTDNSTDDVTASCTFSPSTALTTSDTEITVSYTENGTTKTATQAITVNEYKDYVTLPFSWDGGTSSALTALTGVTAEGLGGDYAEGNAPYRVKFDTTGDYILIKTDGQPGKVTIGVKMLGGSSASSIKVQGSANGESFTDIETLSISGSQNDVLSLETSNAFDATHRYVKLLFTKGSNVGVGPISIAKPSSDPIINADAILDLAADATSGEIAYIITNPVEGTNLTASEEADWITDVTVSSDKVSFTTSANTGAERSAVITLTYGSVTKEVTVTQADGTPVTNTTYSLATSVVPGRHYIVVGVNNNVYKAMGAQNDNNRAAVGITVENNSTTIASNAGVKEVLIGFDQNSGYLTIYDEEAEGYLYAACGTGTSNYMRTETSLDEEGYGLWTISIAENGVASVKAKSGSHNVMMYNSSNGLFSCYASNQKDVYLYEKVGDTGTQDFTVSINSACTDGSKYYGTFSAPFAFTVPSDVTVSEIGVIDDELLVEEYEAGTVIPANTGVMISSATAGDKTFTSAKGGTSVLGDDNNLRPTIWGVEADDMTAADANSLYYRLTMHNGSQIGFWWGAEDGAAFDYDVANRAYLAVPNSASGARIGFTFGGEATGISATLMNNEKVNSEVYNLNGQRVAQPTKGLYIVNGRKVVVK